MNLVFTGHAIRQMFARSISENEISAAAESGITIITYDEDRPYPSRLVLYRSEARSLHVVLAYDHRTDVTYVVTAYVPDPQLWSDDFTVRRSR